MADLDEFGGKLVKAAPVDEFGGKLVVPPDVSRSKTQTPPRVGGQNVLDYTNETLSNVPGSAAKLLGNVGQAIIHPIDTIGNISKVITGTAQKMTPGYVTPTRPGYSKEAEAAGEALKERYGSLPAIANTIKTDPVGAAADVATVAGGVSGLARGGAKLASGAPRLASTLNRVADVAATTSDVVNPLTVPLKAAGSAAKTVARPFVKSALGLPGKAERYGANPAREVLEETKGITPEAVRSSALKRIDELGKELDAVTAKAERAGASPSLAKARQVLIDKIDEVKRANGLTDDLAPMLDQLTNPRPGFAGATEYPAGTTQQITFQQSPSPVLGSSGRPAMGPPRATPAGPTPEPVVSAAQSPSDFLEMKRKFGDKYTKFDYAVPLSNRARSLGNQAYHELSSEFNRKVPGAEPINTKIQGLVPAAQGAQRAEESADAVQRAVNRATRPTGGLAATLFGLHEGGLAGGIGAMTVQEALSSPTVRMSLARALYGTGKGLSAPITRRGMISTGVAGEAGTPDPRFNLRNEE